jgi:CelD/BcsL family acetyltransferase involved in cellulose biosynthesis
LFTVAAENSFDFLSPEYRTLFDRSCATAFQHPVWLDRLYRNLAPRLDAEPLVIAVRRREDGQLAMILPLLRRRHGVMRVIEFADLRISDYVAPVCDEATFALLVRDAEARNAIREALQPFDFLRIQKLREDALPLHALLGDVSHAPMGMSAHSVALYGPAESWRADKIDRSYRKELDKKGRQIRRKGDIRFGIASDPESIRTTFEHMREYRLPRFQDREAPDLLQSATYFEFYIDLAIKGTAAGMCRTYTLWLDERPISGVWGLVHRGQFLTVLGGFDLAGYKNYSIGALVFEAIARDCIERGETLLDFTIGDESYKQLFGTEPTAMWMMSGSGTSLGRLAGFVTEQMPWTMRLAKRIANRGVFAR